MIPQIVGTMGPIHHDAFTPGIEELLLDASLHRNPRCDLVLITELQNVISILLNQSVQQRRQFLGWGVIPLDTTDQIARLLTGNVTTWT